MPTGSTVSRSASVMRFAEDAATGFVAGVVGTAAMSGTALTVRRVARPPGNVGKTHYESVVEWAWNGLAPASSSLSLDPALRCRLGELAHFTFGGIGGAALATTCRYTRATPSAATGFGLGIVMWASAFGGYMPKLGITGGLRDWDNHERFRTFAAHAAYGITCGLVLRSLERNR